MWDFAKSVLSFSWAMSLFGIQQMANIFAPSKAAKSFQSVTHSVEEGLSSPLKTVYRTGDALQKGFVDYTRSAFTGQALTPDRSSPPSIPGIQEAASIRQNSQGISDVAPPVRQVFALGSPLANFPRSAGGWGPMPGASIAPDSSPTAPQTSQPSVEEEISPEFSYESHYADIFGSRMHYIEEGTGDPILLLHGNPTWCYIWRNIIPHLSPLGRCIAPDLIGYGRSAKPDIEYGWFDHARYLEKFIDTMGLKNITLVLHDHGSGLGFHYAMRNEENVRGIAFFEAIVRPYPWDQFSSPEFRELFRKFRSGGVGGEGWQLLVEQNMFIEQLLPQAAGRPLSEKEKNFYREPFPTPESRVPIWRLARETPIGGDPPDVWDVVAKYSERLQRSELPKLMLYVTPGALLTAEHVNWCSQNIENLKAVYVSPGLHFIQESSPHQIGREIAAWYRSSCAGEVRR